MAEIFNITHETGDLSEYSSTVTDSGDLSVSLSAGLAGTSYGLQALIDDTNAIYATKNFTQLTTDYHRLRFYLDPNGLTMASGDNFVLFRANYTGSAVSMIRMGKDGTGLYIEPRLAQDGFTLTTGSKVYLTDEPHYVEYLVQYATGSTASDAYLDFYVDGVYQNSITGLDLFDAGRIDNVSIGPIQALDAGTSGTIYLDELVLRDDATEIGPVSSGAMVWLYFQQTSIAL